MSTPLHSLLRARRSCAREGERVGMRYARCVLACGGRGGTLAGCPLRSRDVYAMLEDAAAERQTPDHDMWQDRAPQLQPTRQASEPAEMWPTAGAKRALLSRRRA